MPIYEFYCPQNHKIYQFYARTLAQGRVAPPCPDDPSYEMRRIVSAFSVAAGAGRGEAGAGAAAETPGGPDEGRMEAALGAMEREFAGVDENDPRAMGRMMRRMAEITGEPMDGKMEEVVRRLEEGADPDSLDEGLAGADDEAGAEPGPAGAQGRGRPRRRRPAPQRDPRLYDYP